jgi:hypothetical protein
MLHDRKGLQEFIMLLSTCVVIPFAITTDCKLNQGAQIEIATKKRSKSQAKKITGFQVHIRRQNETLAKTVIRN